MADGQSPRIVERPLAKLGGAVPDAPAWFRRALAHLPEEQWIEVDGARVETLSWGHRGRPGLLFIHGNLAHARWWSFIAPFFADTHRITALSLSGMGGSDHRSGYNMDLFAREARLAAEAGGLFDAALPPVVIGHSAGAGPAATLAAQIGERLRAVVILDSGIRPETMMPPRPEPRTGSRLFPTLEAALAGYRFAPPQPADNLFIVDWVARHGLKAVDGGWIWRFDPAMFGQVRASEAWPALLAAQCPVAFINGDRSLLTPPDRVAYVRAQLPTETPFVTIADAAHHLMIDQPIALVAALRALLEGWGHRPWSRRRSRR